MSDPRWGACAAGGIATSGWRRPHSIGRSSCSTLTLADARWRGRLKEIARARELLCDAASGGREYGATLDELDRYFLEFALLARNRR